MPEPTNTLDDPIAEAAYSLGVPLETILAAPDRDALRDLVLARLEAHGRGTASRQLRMFEEERASKAAS